MKLEKVVHRIAADPAFAAAAREDLRSTLAREGIELQPAEIAALESALSEASEARDLLSALADPTVWWSPQFEPQSS